MAARKTTPRRINLWHLPRILNVSARLVNYAQPKIFFIGPQRKEIRRAVEITVQTDSPIPTRALGPVVWIGEVPVAEMGSVGENLYKFYAIEPARLVQGAAISFGWSEEPAGGGPVAQRVRTSFRFRLGDTPVA